MTLKSRNKREGRYRDPMNATMANPAPRIFLRERKRGLNSRRITAQFFNNGERYDRQNPDPTIINKS